MLIGLPRYTDADGMTPGDGKQEPHIDKWTHETAPSVHIRSTNPNELGRD